MEILQLRYFYESAKNENFAKTAEKFMVPTTSVSASVKRLENELGCKLFDRTSNRIILNNNGKRFQQSLCMIFDELEHAVENLSDNNHDDREIKMLVRAVRSNITDYIIEYNSMYPNIVFKTVFDFNDNDFEKYDIIIDEKTNAYQQYENFELYTMRLRIIASSNSPLCKRKLTIRQLCNQSFISWSEQSNMHKILVKCCSLAGFSPNIVVMTNDIKCYEKLIESGIGIGLARETYDESYQKGVNYLDITDFDERYTVYSYYKKQACYGNVEHFLNFLRTKAV